MSNDGAAALEAWCTQMGVDVPPIPEKLRAAVHRLDANTFSTWPGAKFLYEAEAWVSLDGPASSRRGRGSAHSEGMVGPCGHSSFSVRSR